MKFKKIIAGILAFAIAIVFLPKTNFENYVKAYISSDNFNLHTYMADNILVNRRFNYYYNDSKPMAEIWLDSVTPTFKSAVSAWENVNLALSPDDIPSKAIEAKGYYMTVILSMIQASYEGDHVVDKLVNADIKEASTLYNGFAKLFKEMSNSDIESYLSKGSFTDDEVALLNAVQKKFLEDNKFLSAGKTASDIIDMVNLAKKPTEYVDKFIQYCNVYEISNDWKECLQEMYNKSPKDGSPLYQALETLIYASQDINNAVYQIWADGFEEITNEFYKFAVKELIKVITDCCPLVKGMKIGQIIGKSISNLLFSTDKTIEEYYVITAYCQVADLFKSVFDDKINQYKNNKTTDNAQKFLTYLDMYFQVYITGNEFGQDFTDAMYKGGIVTYIARSRDEYENFIEYTKYDTNMAISAHQDITTSWLNSLYNDNLEMYEIYAAVLGDLANTYIEVTRVEFEKESVEWGLQDFDHTGYKCTVYPENAANKDLIYTSSDSSVAEISNKGVLRLNSTGTCVITVQAIDNENIYDTLYVTVIQEGGADSIKQTSPFETTVPESSDKDWEYRVNNDNETVTITGYNGNGTAITIPNTINDKMVTGIGNEAFRSCKFLTSVVIPNSVTSLDDKVFYNCISLTSVVIPDSVTSIKSYAFYLCESLTSIVIPNSVTSIGNAAFRGCDSLTSVIIPDSVISIGSHAFYWCKSLTTVVIPNSLTSIGDYAFGLCESLTSVVIPDSVTSIGNRAFYGCSSLTSVIIPDSVTCICDSAFGHCSSLTSVIIPNSVTSIGNDTFACCGSLTSVVIPDSVTSIGDGAFLDCRSLTSVIIPDSVTSIGDEAFRCCMSLISIVIPSSVTSIGNSAFDNFTNQTIYGIIGSYAETYANENNILFKPIKSLYFDDTESGIKIEGLFPPEAFLVVEVLDEAADDTLITYNITFKNSEGNIVQPYKDVTVKIPVPNRWKGNKCKVYRKEANGEYTDMNATCENNYMVFVTDHFSEYIVTSEKLVPDTVIGDINTDGRINDQDSILLSRHLSEWGNTIDISAADMNGDGKVNDQDSIILARTLAGWYD